MQGTHVPQLNGKYWIALMLASVFGANTGDFFADVLDLGHVSGLPVLAVLFVLILIVERYDKRQHQAYFWSAIVVVRTSATNLGDLAHDWRLDAHWVITVLALLLAAVVAVWRRSQVASAPARADILATTTVYWLSMLLAGTLGTAVGDYCSFGLRLFPLRAAGVLALILALAFAACRRRLRRESLHLGCYWLVVVLIRSAGTAAGDFLAQQLQLPLSTALSGLALVLLLLLWRSPRRLATPALNGR